MLDNKGFFEGLYQLLSKRCSGFAGLRNGTGISTVFDITAKRKVLMFPMPDRLHAIVLDDQRIDRAKVIVWVEDTKLKLEIFNARRTDGRPVEHREYYRYENAFLEPEVKHNRMLFHWLSFNSEEMPAPFTVKVREDNEIRLRGLPVYSRDAGNIPTNRSLKNRDLEVRAFTEEEDVAGRTVLTRKVKFSTVRNGGYTVRRLLEGKFVSEARSGYKSFLVYPGDDFRGKHPQIKNTVFIFSRNFMHPIKVKVDRTTRQIESIRYNSGTAGNEESIPNTVIRQGKKTCILIGKGGISVDMLKGIDHLFEDASRIHVSKEGGSLKRIFLTLFGKHFRFPQETAKIIYEKVKAGADLMADARIEDGHIVEVIIREGNREFMRVAPTVIRDASSSIAHSFLRKPKEVDIPVEGPYSVENARTIDVGGIRHLVWGEKDIDLTLFFDKKLFVSFSVDEAGEITRVDLWDKPVSRPYIVSLANRTQWTDVRQQVALGFVQGTPKRVNGAGEVTVWKAKPEPTIKEKLSKLNRIIANFDRLREKMRYMRAADDLYSVAASLARLREQVEDLSARELDNVAADTGAGRAAVLRIINIKNKLLPDLETALDAAGHSDDVDPY